MRCSGALRPHMNGSETDHYAKNSLILGEFWKFPPFLKWPNVAGVAQILMKLACNGFKMQNDCYKEYYIDFVIVRGII